MAEEMVAKPKWSDNTSAVAAQKRYRSKPEARAKIRVRERLYFQRTKDIQYANRRRNVARDPCIRIKRNLRARLWDALRRDPRKSRGGSAVRDLGCGISEFREYIAAQFLPGMSWDNWGEWHLDHIKPLCDFDLTVREQVLKACHYTNLRPLWAKDNLSRNRRLKSKTYENGGV